MSTYSPYVGALAATPQSHISVQDRKVSWQSLGPPAFNIGTYSQASAASAASTTNTIDFYRQTSTFGKYGGYMALFGGMLFQLTLGSWFCFGNLIPYVASYMAYNANLESSFTLSDDQLAAHYDQYIANGNVVFMIAMIFNALCCIFGGNLELQLGPTKTLIITGVLVSAGFGLTYFGLIWNSFGMIYIVFGVVFGAGVGLGYPVQPIVCMRWFPEKRGVVNGFTSALFGSAPFIFNPIQSKMVNPDNILTNARWGFAKDLDVLERIPVMFVYVAALMLIMQAVSLMMIQSPPWFVVVTGDNAGGAHGGVSKSQLKYEAHSLSVKQTLTFPAFWAMFIMNCLYTSVLCWLTAQWKVFSAGYMGIRDDGLLAIIGSICAISNGIGRFFWGVFYDYTHSFRISQGIQCGVVTAFCLTIPFIKIGDDTGTTTVLLTIWMVVMWGCAGCNYSFFPSVLIETFGAKHVGELIGIFIISEPVAVAWVVFLNSFPFLSQNFEYYAWVIGCCSGLSLILTLLIDVSKVDRKGYLKNVKALTQNVQMQSYDAV